MAEEQIESLWRWIETEAWENYDKADALYHITDISNIEFIKALGLVAINPVEEGGPPVIFVFVDQEYAEAVARSIGLRRFGLIRIDKAAVPKQTLHWDKVAEFCAIVSFYTTVQRIRPKYIKLVGCFEHVSSQAEKGEA